MDNLLSLFHHVHHKNGVHTIHHCGGKHKEIFPELDYTIEHCSCGKHKIDKEIAIGHGIGTNLESPEIKIKFIETCPDGGWHIESGIKS